MSKGMKGLAVGAMVGAAISIVAFPELNRKTQRSIKRTGRRVMGMAEDVYGNVLDHMK